MHLLDPNFKIFSERFLEPSIKGGPSPPRGPDKTTAHIFISIVRRLLKVFLPLLQIFWGPVKLTDSAPPISVLAARFRGFPALRVRVQIA